jgi:hypothetical protein
LREKPLVLEIVMLACGTSAPEESVTEPLTVPVADCAFAEGHRARPERDSITVSTRRMTDVFMTFSLALDGSFFRVAQGLWSCGYIA